MFDADQKLVVCNQRYADMYHIPRELTRPGTSLTDILKQRFASGVQTPLDVDAFVRDRLDRQQDAIRIDVLSDGRIIQATRRADGIGLGRSPSTRTSPSARGSQRSSSSRTSCCSSASSELKSRNADLDAALANMTHGIAMFDADERLVVANQRYAEIYGLTPRGRSSPA